MSWIKKCWSWFLKDMEPQAPVVRKVEHLGFDGLGNPVYKSRVPLQSYDHKQLHDPEEMEKFLDHVEDSAEDLLDSFIGSGASYMGTTPPDRRK